MALGVGSWCLFLVALSSTCRTFASDTDGSVARVFDTAGSGAHVFDTAGALARVFEGLNEGFNISHYLFSTGKLSSNGEGRSFFSKPRRRAFSLGLFSVPDDTTLRGLDLYDLLIPPMALGKSVETISVFVFKRRKFQLQVVRPFSDDLTQFLRADQFKTEWYGSIRYKVFDLKTTVFRKFQGPGKMNMTSAYSMLNTTAHALWNATSAAADTSAMDFMTGMSADETTFSATSTETPGAQSGNPYSPQRLHRPDGHGYSHYDAHQSSYNSYPATHHYQKTDQFWHRNQNTYHNNEDDYSQNMVYDNDQSSSAAPGYGEHTSFKQKSGHSDHIVYGQPAYYHQAERPTWQDASAYNGYSSRRGSVDDPAATAPPESSATAEHSELDQSQAFRFQQKMGIYQKMEGIYDRQGQDGRQCVLLAICEVSEAPIEDGVLGDVVNMLLSATNGVEDLLHKKTLDPRYQPYLEAHIQGELRGECHRRYPSCTLNVFDPANFVY